MIRLIGWWLREGIPQRLRYHWVRKNPWLRARQLDTERAYWKRKLDECQADARDAHPGRG